MKFRSFNLLRGGKLSRKVELEYNFLVAGQNTSISRNQSVLMSSLLPYVAFSAHQGFEVFEVL